MPDAHARLSPSAASRWLACPGSVDRSAGYPNTSGPDAERGTCAHALLERDTLTGEPPCLAIGDVVEGVKVDRHIAGWAEQAAQWVRAYRVAHPGATILAEHQVDIGLAFGLATNADGKTDLWGTADLFAVDAGELVVFDFKSGRHDVSPTMNKQLLLYASGYERTLSEPVRWIRLVIHQPRCGGAKESHVSIAEFREWKAGVRDAILAATLPNAAIVPGDKQCQWCLARHDCKERQEWAQAQASSIFDAA